MAGISIVWTKTDGSSFTTTATVSEIDVGRLVMAHATKYNIPLDQVDAILAKVGEEWIVMATNYCLQYEKQAAAQAASDAVTMIPVSIT